MTLVDPCVVCGKEHTCNDSSAGLWFQYNNKHAMTLVVDPCVVCGNNTHAMIVMDPYVICENNTHAMPLVDPYVVCEKNRYTMTTC